MDPNEKFSVALTMAQWNALIQMIWKSATCEFGMPLIEAIRPQLEAKPQMMERDVKPIRKVSNNNVSLTSEDD